MKSELDVVNGKLFLQYVPDEEGTTRLTELQETFVESYGGKEVPVYELHLTLLHIGILEAVLADIQRARPELTAEEFRAAFEDFVEQVGGILPTSVEFRPTGIDTFGARNTQLVLRGDIDEKLKQAHGYSLGLLKETIAQCLQTEPDAFMQDSPNFRHALDFVPHISLLRNAKSDTQAEVNDLPVMRLNLSPIDEDLKRGNSVIDRLPNLF